MKRTDQEEESGRDSYESDPRESHHGLILSNLPATLSRS
jgi:hypothetical protein